MERKTHLMLVQLSQRSSSQESSSKRQNSIRRTNSRKSQPKAKTSSRSNKRQRLQKKASAEACESSEEEETAFVYAPAKEDEEKKHFEADFQKIAKVICASPECLADRKFHRHSSASCKKHHYCVEPPIAAKREVINEVPLPVPISVLMQDRGLNKLGGLAVRKHQADLLSHEEQAYLKQVEAKDFGHDGPKTEDTKVVVTKYGLYHWLAQQYNLKLDEIPSQCPTKLEKSIYAEFKHFKKKKTHQDTSKKAPRQAGWQKALASKMSVQQEEAKKEGGYRRGNNSVKSRQEKTLKQMQAENPMKHAERDYFTCDYRQLRPIVWPLTKSTTPFYLENNEEPLTSSLKIVKQQTSAKDNFLKLAHFENYKRPRKEIRKLLQSEFLSDINKVELEQSCLDFEEFKKFAKTTKNEHLIPKAVSPPALETLTSERKNVAKGRQPVQRTSQTVKSSQKSMPPSPFQNKASTTKGNSSLLHESVKCTLHSSTVDYATVATSVDNQNYGKRTRPKTGRSETSQNLRRSHQTRLFSSKEASMGNTNSTRGRYNERTSKVMKSIDVDKFRKTDLDFPLTEPVNSIKSRLIETGSISVLHSIQSTKQIWHLTHANVPPEKLVGSMEALLTKYKPSIPPSIVTQTRLSQNMSVDMKNTQQLQQILRNSFGLEKLTKVFIPQDCQSFLKETVFQEARANGRQQKISQHNALSLKNKRIDKRPFTASSKTAKACSALSDASEKNTFQVALSKIKTVKDAYMTRQKQLENTRKEKDNFFELGEAVTSKDLVAKKPRQSVIAALTITANYQGEYGASVANEEEQVKILARITQDLDSVEPEKQAFVCLSDDALIETPDFTMDALELKQFVKNMATEEFWLQKGLNCTKEGKLDAALDYFRQGLRKNTTSIKLLYNFANNYKKQKRFAAAITWFRHGLSFYPRWVDGLVGIATCYYNTCDFVKALSFIQRARENYKSQKLTPLVTYEVICFIHATCLKKAGHRELAENHYHSLRPTFKRHLVKDLIKKVFGLMLIPLQDNRKLQQDHLKSVAEYMLFLQTEAETQPARQTGMLRYCRKEDAHFILDWHTYPSTIVKRLKGLSFFKRFSNFTSQFPELFDGAEVVTLKKDQVLFLEGKVGIILEGSIVSNSHADNLLKPFVIKKNVQGGILGFEKGDNDLGENPLVWHIANEDATDLLLVTAEQFERIWQLQRKDSQHQILLTQLENNPFFKPLNMLTKYFLVYEALQEQVYFPGELILSANQRSPLNEEFYPFFKNRISQLRVDHQATQTDASKKKVSLYAERLNSILRPENKSVPEQMEPEPKLQNEEQSTESSDEDLQRQEDDLNISFDSDFGEKFEKKQLSEVETEKPFHKLKFLPFSRNRKLHQLRKINKYRRMNTKKSQQLLLQSNYYQQLKLRKTQIQPALVGLELHLQRLANPSEKVTLKYNRARAHCCSRDCAFQMKLSKCLYKELELSSGRPSTLIAGGLDCIEQANALVTMAAQVFNRALELEQIAFTLAWNQRVLTESNIQHSALFKKLQQGFTTKIKLTHSELVEQKLKSNLLKLIVDFISFQDLELNKFGKRSTGVHIMEQGSASIVDGDENILHQLERPAVFGESDFVQKAGADFMGNIRAGLNGAKTFFLSYEDLRRQVSFPEIVRLSDSQYLNELFLHQFQKHLGALNVDLKNVTEY